jgi:hypothetical protein
MPNSITAVGQNRARFTCSPWDGLSDSGGHRMVHHSTQCNLFGPGAGRWIEQILVIYGDYVPYLRIA